MKSTENPKNARILNIITFFQLFVAVVTFVLSVLAKDFFLSSTTAFIIFIFIFNFLTKICKKTKLRS